MKDVPPPLPPPPKNLTLGERIARVSRLYPDAMKDIDSASPEVLRAITLELGWIPNPNAGLSAREIREAAMRAAMPDAAADNRPLLSPEDIAALDRRRPPSETDGS